MSSRSSASRKSVKELKTFTYFIPAPPQRKTGYREKEFDKIMHGILNSGFELVELHTNAVENGLFMVAVLKAPSKKVAMLDINFDLQDRFTLSNTSSSPDIMLDDEDA